MTSHPQLLDTPAEIPGGARYQQLAYLAEYDAVLNGDDTLVAHKETDSLGWRVRIRSARFAWPA